MYYIYAYIDPRTDLPFYIGKGKRYRKTDHLRETVNKTENRDKLAVILELRSLGLEPKIIELESDIDNEAMAYNREDYFILLHGRKGIEPNGILTNKILGGAPLKPIWTEEKKKAHSDFNKSYWTPERRKQHGASTKGNTGGIGTVCVTTLSGITFRVDKAIYDSMDRSKPITEWEYVSVSSKEAKRRRLSYTLP